MTTGRSTEPGARYPLLASTRFVRFWLADSVSMFGTYITAQALQLLAVLTLGASTFELGALRAAQWAPYLLFGLLVGVLVDRYRRKPILVGADIIRAGLLTLIPLAVVAQVLSMPMLIVLVSVFGAVSLAYDAAHQSFLPNLVPPQLLTQANARLEQSSSVAQIGGQGVAGILIKLVGPPAAVLVDAVSYLISGLVLATLPVTERTSPPGRSTRSTRNLRAELREGLRWVYRHPALGPLALSSHAWFFFTSMVSTIYPYFVVRHLGFDAAAHGLTLAAGGIGAVAGSSIAVRAGRRFGVGPAIIACRWLAPAGYALIPLAHSGTGGFTILCVAQFAFWLSVGIDSPVEMGYRQSITPDRLLGRMNATMRSMNRGAIVIGAPLGGALAGLLGLHPALWAATGGLILAALTLNASPFRHARLDGGW
ncbi:MFS transporter [Nocardia sp. BMG51109]|uniref:MFS transporter n=1 Tax=Nocardia sp. BMG51109 TaxID=1056816 RepID=UPI0004636E76|nr:MFS transporter [Nocardia sp. BMG51109]